MSRLVEFVTARLNEDERVARSAGGTWRNGMPAPLADSTLSRTVVDPDREGVPARPRTVYSP